MMDMQEIFTYLRTADLSDVPGWQEGQCFEVLPLAQGEYNLNYLVRQGDGEWVFRVNLGTQIDRGDQIVYEYEALRLLSETGMTPQPYYVDNTHQRLPHGVLLMEYLVGEPLNYRRDVTNAAGLFASIHGHTHHLGAHHLILEEHPLSMTYAECERLLKVYFESALGVPEVKTYLHEVLDWAAQALKQEVYFSADPWKCIINTEVNSGNFIVNRELDKIYLVDWEKPLWGDPSQDLSHFCVPTTTLWKTDYRMTEADRRQFLEAYRARIANAHLRDTIEDRVRLRDPFNCLRGISWSAMAWVTYQSGAHTLKNSDTFEKIKQYLKMDFLRSLFDPYMRGNQ
ncbi:aminoglycoside phosphotransferase family protein [bacterium]|nr:aminoglycoside phosphotransferase family protein [bacterium]